ncbi:hypothetical protein SAMIE_1013910 [Sphingobium amiense]|uniref:DUF2336 domain-containing protein n=1 Tax=Sphingobium amiense TaxID=135719 RepID=A0A494WAW9_9SPHN|nr:hypothetical protein [Sphingobium amiense]BBD97890.1 hypothetical protein SAMIE_1013910 [Sphingobium amiense]
MNAFSSLNGMGMAGGWPVAQVMAGASAVPLGHAVDLAFFFERQDDSRQDALIVEARRHLAGCVHAIEMALRLSLSHAPSVAAALDRLEPSLCWAMIRLQPELLSPSLLAHMRLRAAITLMLRQQGRGAGDAGLHSVADHAAADADTPSLEAAAGLALAEGRWLMPGGEDRPMRPDLPVEHYAELVWTVAACLALAVRRGGAEDGGVAYAALERSGWALLADHDESASPIALADDLVRQLGEGAGAPDLLGRALEEQRFLLFAALAARRLHMDSGQVAEILLLGPVGDVALLCHALGGSDAEHRRLLLWLRPVRPSLSDTLMLEQVERHAAVTGPQADEALALWRTPVAFRAKLTHLRGVTPA